MSSDGHSPKGLEAPHELIARARHDRAAFGELYDQYLPRVYGFCYKYARTREEAEDLTAETFERALGAISRYEDRGVPFSVWLLRVARNVILNHSRRAGRVIRLSRDPGELVDESDLDDWEEAYWLRSHVDALSEDQRNVIRLRFYEDRRFVDVATMMDRSEGAVKQLLRRALAVLNREINGEVEEGATNE